MFYYDPSDPRIFVPKVTGLGWTLNWAHPLSWVVLIVIIAVGATLSYLRRHWGQR